MIPQLYKVSFMRQYRHSLAHSNPANAASPSNSFGHGPVPIVLLLSMFALSARYCDLYPTSGSDGKFWDAGQEFLDKARKILNHEYGSSKLVMVQTLLLMAYREIGVGAMSSAWMAGGMAIRMAQDLGLFRDVEKWFLPVQRFSHEEKQTRKRVWWGCIIIGKSFTLVFRSGLSPSSLDGTRADTSSLLFRSLHFFVYRPTGSHTRARLRYWILLRRRTGRARTVETDSSRWN